MLDCPKGRRRGSIHNVKERGTEAPVIRRAEIAHPARQVTSEF